MADARRARAAAVFERTGTPGTTALPTGKSRVTVDLPREEYSDLQVWMALTTQSVGRKVTSRAVFRALLAELRATDDAGELTPEAAALESRIRDRLRHADGV